jgi:hypothetical protein
MWNGRGTEGWTCKPRYEGDGGQLIAHNYQCGAPRTAQNGPLILNVTDANRTVLDGIHTDGTVQNEDGSLHLILQNVGEFVPPTATTREQTIWAGPFECQSYGEFSPHSTGRDKYFTDYYCKSIPGIGDGEGQGWDLQVRVRGMPNSTIGLGASPKPYIKYVPPLLTSVSITSMDKTGACTPSKGKTECRGDPGDILTLRGKNFPVSNATIKAWEHHSLSQQPGFLVTIGSKTCTPILKSETEATCVVPEGQGKGQQINVVVGGVTDTTEKGAFTFDFHPPAITKICADAACAQPASGPSYGSQTITIQGKGFGAAGDAVTVTMSSTNNASYTPQCSGATHDAKSPDTQLTCTTPVSGGIAADVFTVEVEAGGQTSDISADTCKFNTDKCDNSRCGKSVKGMSTGKCSNDGDCGCSGNFHKVISGAGAGKQVCQCDTTACAHGTMPDVTTCACSCPQKWQPTPAPPPGPDLAPPGRCDSCSVPCTGLSKSAPEVTGQDCLCHFNGLHVLWMVALGLLVIAGIFVGYKQWQKRSEYSKEDALLDPTKTEEGRDSQPSETQFM